MTDGCARGVCVCVRAGSVCEFEFSDIAGIANTLHIRGDIFTDQTEFNHNFYTLQPPLDNV